MEFAMGATMITVTSLHDGTASLYTTSDFGVIGGGQHATVREAALKFVTVAQSHYARGVPAGDFTYAGADTVRFYLLGYEGLRKIEDSLSQLGNGTGAEVELWKAGQDVLTALRRAAEGR